MSARRNLEDKIRSALGAEYMKQAIDRFEREYAHELAEQIREAEVDEEDPQIYYGRWEVGMRMAADLIDPGLNND